MTFLSTPGPLHVKSGLVTSSRGIIAKQERLSDPPANTELQDCSILTLSGGGSMRVKYLVKLDNQLLYLATYPEQQ